MDESVTLQRETLYIEMWGELVTDPAVAYGIYVLWKYWEACRWITIPALRTWHFAMFHHRGVYKGCGRLVICVQ